MFIFLSLVEVTIEPSSEHMHFLQRSAKCSALIVTLLNPDILQPLQSCTGGLGRYVGGKPCGSFVSSAAILKACSESDICTPKTQG